MKIFTVFFGVLVANFEFAGLAPKQNTRVGPFPWKWSVLQNLDRERTNQSTGICLRLALPYNNIQNPMYDFSILKLMTVCINAYAS